MELIDDFILKKQTNHGKAPADRRHTTKNNQITTQTRETRGKKQEEKKYKEIINNTNTTKYSIHPRIIVKE
jgi:muramidase (phage lysozyme)